MARTVGKLKENGTFSGGRLDNWGPCNVSGIPETSAAVSLMPLSPFDGSCLSQGFLIF